jgi:hypothetical protein
MDRRLDLGNRSDNNDLECATTQLGYEHHEDEVG